MIGARREYISPLRPHGCRSQHKAGWRAFLRSAPGSRRSCADGVFLLLRRTKRTSKPHRRLPHRTDRIAPWRAFRRRVSSRPPASTPGRVRRRRRPLGAFVLRSGDTTRLRCARACGVCSSPAPCAGGSRDLFHRRVPPRFSPWRSGRVLNHAPSLRRARMPCARAREVRGRISDKGPSPCAWPSAACSVRAHKPVEFPGPCGTWNFPHVLDKPFRRRWDGETSCATHPRHSIRAHTRCSPQS